MNVGTIKRRRRDGCGLPVDGDSLSADGREFHRSYALCEPESQADVQQREYRSLLKRMAHWGNSLRWG